MFFAFAVGFFIYGPRAIGGSVDYVLGALLGLGILFAFRTRNTKNQNLFEGRDLTPDQVSSMRRFPRPARRVAAAVTAAGSQTPVRGPDEQETTGRPTPGIGNRREPAPQSAAIENSRGAGLPVPVGPGRQGEVAT